MAERNIREREFKFYDRGSFDVLHNKRSKFLGVEYGERRGRFYNYSDRGNLMNGKKIAGMVLIGVGGADLILGNTQTPLPIIGDYLTQQMDIVLIAAGVAILFFL